MSAAGKIGIGTVYQYIIVLAVYVIIMFPARVILPGTVLSGVQYFGPCKVVLPIVLQYGSRDSTVSTL